MIKLTDMDGRAHYLHRDAIAKVTEAGTSSAWHGIRAYVKTFDGKILEVREYPAEIVAQVECAHLPPEVAPLMDFYSAGSVEDLVMQQARHIEKLQATLPPLKDEQPTNPRIA